MTYQKIHLGLFSIFAIICSIIMMMSSELGMIRGYIGDVIIVMLIYSLLQSIHHMGRAKCMTFVLVLAYTIEILQFFHFIDLIGGSHNSLLLFVFGSVWDPLDLIAYTIGGILIGLIDRNIGKRYL